MSKETNQYIVLEDGFNCKLVNPHENKFTGGVYNDGHTTEYWEFDKANPTHPIATDKAMQPGLVFDGGEVKQYKFMDLEWLTCGGYYTKERCEHDGIPSRIAIQPKVVSPAKGEDGISEGNEVSFEYYTEQDCATGSGKIIWINKNDCIVEDTNGKRHMMQLSAIKKL